MAIFEKNSSSLPAEKYEWKSAAITIAGSDGDTNIKDAGGITTLFNTVPEARRIVVESSGAAYIRVNSATNDKITLGATAPFEADMTVRSLFLSTGGAAITITVKLFA
jgi:hypothetical protein